LKRELLVTCLFCGRKNFTPRGLRAHWCGSKAAHLGYSKHSAPLTKQEWKRCVDAAKAQREAKEVSE
jgi:hypothetical protein